MHCKIFLIAYNVKLYMYIYIYIYNNDLCKVIIYTLLRAINVYLYRYYIIMVIYVLYIIYIYIYISVHPRFQGSYQQQLL